MSIECRPSNLSSDIRCAVCGQGFLLYGDHRSTHERRVVRETVQQMLRAHHAVQQHHDSGFVVDLDSELTQV
jgi:hypothetical protein